MSEMKTMITVCPKCGGEALSIDRGDGKPLFENVQCRKCLGLPDFQEQTRITITKQRERIRDLETVLTECLESAGKAVELIDLKAVEEDNGDIGMERNGFNAIETLLRTIESRARLALGEKAQP
jgi:hypothetical protein